LRIFSISSPLGSSQTDFCTVTQVDELQKTSENTDRSEYSPPTTVEVARWAGFEETADWCLRVGYTLSKNREFDEAINFLQQSLRGGKG
jgi:hypothetical protein